MRFHQLRLLAGLLIACLCAAARLPADEPTARLTVDAPSEYQVLQRNAKNVADVQVSGRLPAVSSDSRKVEVSVLGDEPAERWQTFATIVDATTYQATLQVPAGGWYRLEVRDQNGGQTVATSVVEHFGVGEIFVVTGQSNSANHGEEKQETQTRRVATWDGKAWQLANDPQPGASGRGGSFMPPLGDAIVTRFDVPVGFVACGIGATSVREWLPVGETFPNPPTLVSRVERLPDGQWASQGEAFKLLVARMKELGNHGFRAVLWHQGESDANQQDPMRTLSGELYSEYLEKIIRQSRREIGWDAPWFVAQASYHVPDDAASPSIRAAQASLWHRGIALEGPDTDELTGPLRANNGQGVHFSAAGLRAHAAGWAEKVIPWLAEQ
jgi:hypothetical protein